MMDLKLYIEELKNSTSFSTAMLEKDYFITLFFQKLQTYIEDGNVYAKSLLFKGGTCLNKCYFGFYRLSEDIDFIINYNDFDNYVTFSKSKQHEIRRNYMHEIRSLTVSIFKEINCFKVEKDRDSFNEHRQMVLYFKYNSQFNSNEEIKLEIGFREKPKANPLYLKVQHLFGDIFSNTIFTNVININEAISEKLRCTFGRLKKKDGEAVVKIAIRDFFDIYYFIKIKENNFYGFSDEKFLDLFFQKNIGDVLDKHKTLDYNFQEDIEYAKIELLSQKEELLKVVFKDEGFFNELDGLCNFIGGCQEALKTYILNKDKNIDLTYKDHLHTILEKYIELNFNK